MARSNDDELLRALCDAFVPALEEADGGRETLYSVSASRLGTAPLVDQGLEKLTPRSRHTLRRIMRALDHPLVTLLWLGRWTRFSDLPASDASRLLEKWSRSRISAVRRAFDVLKRLVLVHAFGSDASVKLVWAARGYDYVDAEATSEPLSAASCPASCETIVIGSGAGGAAAAAHLAAHGHDVVVLEKGREVAPSTLRGVEVPAMHALFEQGGLLTTADGGISLFAGSCLGGGTTVNWSASFRLPDVIRHVWRRVHGIDWMTEPVLDLAYEHVESRTSVGVDRASDNGPNAALREGCTSLGLDVKSVPRNTRGCHGEAALLCGRCGLGCAYGRKQGASATFLTDVIENGGRIVTGAEVERVLFDGDRVKGVEVRIGTESGTKMRQILSERVVVAAGAMHTPAILIRSGFTHEGIGRNLYLHPTVGVAGRYPNAMKGWEGPVMSSYTDAFGWLDGPWGVRIETPPVYPGLLASALPWNTARGHTEDLDLIENTAAFIVLTRDRSGGRVSVDDAGDLVVRYRMSDPDLAMLITGVVETARIHLEAGADSILFPHGERKVMRADRGTDRIADLAREIFTWGWRPGFFPLFSAHQMGTCRMGGNSRTAPVDPEGRVRGVDGLYICDASLFPEAAGVNPALTVQALAHCVARQIA